MKKLFIILGVFFVIISCRKSLAVPDGLSFYFENPQPINDSELSKFPNRFIGLYMNSDSMYIRINENIILSESYTRFRFHKNDMDSLKQEFDYANGNYILKIDKRVYVPKMIGDSIELSTQYVDTIFMFSKAQKAKLLHGQIVLNAKDSVFWKLRILGLEKNKLTLKHLYSEEDLRQMDSITKIKATMLDSSSFVIKPSRREFIKFLKLKSFGYDQEFEKKTN
jgi:hypothetical protein